MICCHPTPRLRDSSFSVTEKDRLTTLTHRGLSLQTAGRFIYTMGGGHTIGNLAIIIIEIHIFRSTDSLIETGDWQFCMFYISRTTPLAFYLVGIFVWSDNTKQKVRLTKVTPFWRVWLVWSYLVVLPYMGIGFEVFISYGSRKQL